MEKEEETNTSIHSTTISFLMEYILNSIKNGYVCMLWAYAIR